MSKLGQQLAKQDDEAIRNPPSLMRRAGAQVLAVVVAVVALVTLGNFVSQGTASLILGGITLVGLTVYIAWRRKRNVALTGSPTST